MDISIVVPIYTADNHLDICLLSILGQVQIREVEVVCVPLADSSLADKLSSWKKRDNRVVITPPAQDLFEALLQGIAMASGEYVLFMNQTDTIADIANLIAALQYTEANEAQILLVAKQQKLSSDSFSPRLTYTARRDILVKEKAADDILSIHDHRALLLLTDVPTVFGNIYQLGFLTNLFQQKHSFGNAGDLLISQVALIHSSRVAFFDKAVIQHSYEGHALPVFSQDELTAVEKALTMQIAVALEEPGAKMIARNIAIYHLAYTISLCHPYNTFTEKAIEYHDAIIHLTNNLDDCNIPHLYHSWQYLQRIIESEGQDLIEAYTMPLRQTVFKLRIEN